MIWARSAGERSVGGGGASESGSAGGGAHAALTVFLKLTAADWRSSTGASVATTCVEGGREGRSVRAPAKNDAPFPSSHSHPSYLQQRQRITRLSGSCFERCFGLLDDGLCGGEGADGRMRVFLCWSAQLCPRASARIRAPRMKLCHHCLRLCAAGGAGRPLFLPIKRTGFVDSVCTSASRRALTRGSSILGGRDGHACGHERPVILQHGRTTRAEC